MTQPPAGDDNSHAEQAAAPPQHQIIPVSAPAQADNTTSYSVIEMLHNNSVEMLRNNSFEMLQNNSTGYSLHTPGGITYNLNTLSNTIDPKCLTKSNDSGYSDLGGPSSQQGTETCRYQYSEVLGEASTEEGARQVTSGSTQVHLHQSSEVQNQTSTGVTSWNEAPKQNLNVRLFQSLNSVIEVLQECKQSPEGRWMADFCARNMALQAPEDFSQAFVETYREMWQEGETQAYGPPHGAKGKEKERE